MWRRLAIDPGFLDVCYSRWLLNVAEPGMWHHGRVYGSHTPGKSLGCQNTSGSTKVGSCQYMGEALFRPIFWISDWLRISFLSLAYYIRKIQKFTGPGTSTCCRYGPKKIHALYMKIKNSCHIHIYIHIYIVINNICVDEEKWFHAFMLMSHTV